MKTYILTLIICITSCLTSLSSEAVSLFTSSNIKVVNPLSVVEEKKLNFGTIVTPGKEEVVEISLAGTVDVGTTAQYLDSSEISEAKIKISGSDLNNINITASYVGNEPKIEVLSMKARYGELNEGDLLSGMNNLVSTSTGVDLMFGAGIKIASSAVEGNYYPVMNLSINYE